jgi:cell division protein FtsZ
VQPSGAAAEALSAGVPPTTDGPLVEPNPPVAAPADDDELLLGSEAVLPTAAPEPVAPAGNADRRRFLAAEEPEAAPPQPRVKLGGTLFERMQSATRAASRNEEEPRDGGDLPRFLNRQNNQ